MACQGEVIIIARPTYVCALCADMCRRPGKKRSSKSGTLPVCGEAGPGPGQSKLPHSIPGRRFWNWKAKKHAHNNRECYTHCIHMGSSASFKSHVVSSSFHNRASTLGWQAHRRQPKRANKHSPVSIACVRALEQGRWQEIPNLFSYVWGVTLCAC